MAQVSIYHVKVQWILILYSLVQFSLIAICYRDHTSKFVLVASVAHAAHESSDVDEDDDDNDDGDDDDDDDVDGGGGGGGDGDDDDDYNDHSVHGGIDNDGGNDAWIIELTSS